MIKPTKVETTKIEPTKIAHRSSPFEWTGLSAAVRTFFVEAFPRNSFSFFSFSFVMSRYLIVLSSQRSLRAAAAEPCSKSTMDKMKTFRPASVAAL
jgi:hypothetical protein